MKVAILAGGKGTRLSEETGVKSKAMVTIGNEPVLWHIIRYYAAFGFRKFVVALGYKAESVQSYFLETAKSVSERSSRSEHLAFEKDGLAIDLIDTGPDTQNGGRIRRLAPYLGQRRFMLTWCDGLADIDLRRLLRFHEDHGRLVTLTAVHPTPRFGRLRLDGELVREFQEKTIDEHEWINGAYFVLEPAILDLIEGDSAHFEHEILTKLATDGELMAFRHPGFWQCMDTLNESRSLNALWRDGKAPWKIWE